MSGRELTLTVNNLAPTAVSSVTTPTGGSWGAKTISFRVVAWYTTAETDVDNVGVTRTAVASWENISVSAGDSVYLTFIPPSQHWNHYAFYYQEASSWNNANAAKKCTATFTQYSESVITCQVDTNDDTATFTFGAAATTFAIDNIAGINATTRPNTIVAYDGTLVKKSYTNEKLYESLDITLTMGSLTASEMKTLLDWIKDSVRVSMVESLSGSDIYIDTFVGKFIDTDYLHTKHKARGSNSFNVIFAVESEVEE